MNRKNLIERTLKRLHLLSDENLLKVEVLIASILEKHNDEEQIQKGINDFVEHSKSYSFLNDDEELYSVNDLKEEYR